MSDIKVTFASAQQKADLLDAEAAKIQSILDQETALINSIAGEWVGGGEEAWAAQQAEWRKEAGEEVAALRGLSAAVRSALGTMKDTETQVAGFFG